MSQNIKVIRKNQCKTSEWSGGKTTELYIYPMDSLYSHLNFKWRLSSALVEVECSTFTQLPGISRIIMIIEGQLILKHEGHHNTTLIALEQDSFSGEWSTISVGKVTDFNLMLAKGYKGKLEAISVNASEFKDIIMNYDEKLSTITEAFYIFKGSIEIDTGLNEKKRLNAGDVAIVSITEQEINSDFKIHGISKGESKIIRASIFKV